MPENDLKLKVFCPIIEQVTINLKYEGYIERQNRQVEQFKKMEGKRIPEQIDFY